MDGGGVEREGEGEREGEVRGRASDQAEQGVQLLVLSFSILLEDFDFLLQLRGTTTDPVVTRDIDMALKRIASNLRAYGNFPTDDSNR